MGKKILVVAGEASGDLHGASLISTLRKRFPEIQPTGIGGDGLRKEMVSLLHDSSGWGAIGIMEAVQKVPGWLRAFWDVKKLIRTDPPDVIVLIDSPAFNVRLARFARKLGIPTVYFFPPSAWSANVRRARQIAQLVTRVIATFAFTASVYRKAGEEAFFFGHPFVDLVQPTASRDEALERFGLTGGGPIVGLLPGSRDHEIRYLLPEMLATASLLLREMPEIRFVLPIATRYLRDRVVREISKASIGQAVSLVEGLTYDAMNVCDLLLVTSGSATLEAACLGKPMVIVYKLSRLTWMVLRLVVKVPYAGLPNLIAEKKIVPEYLQERVKADTLARAVLDLLRDPCALAEMRKNMDLVRSRLGQPGVMERVADVVAETAGWKDIEDKKVGQSGYCHSLK
ncbi:MAG: lipid-A-disaccharide synthase [Armatimonadetes bacterium]|nr:lipid-A-disaccharide synthase [Armatimonadota bacterium]